MARPRNADPEATRRRILEASVRLFGERGVDGVSIREIGRHSGVTLSTVHHYFGTKEQLYEACIDEMYQQLQAMLEELIPLFAADDDPRSRLDASIRHAFRFSRRHRTPIRLLLRLVAARGELDRRRRESTQLPFLELGSQAVARVSRYGITEIRLALTSLVYLLARHAVSTPAELRAITALEDLDEAVQAVEDHLVATGLATLL